MRSRISSITAWLDDRTGLPATLSRFLSEEIPASAGWPQVFGSVALFLFLIQSLTGVLLALNYAPTAGEAYTSLVYITQQVAGGRMIHGLHHWGASLMVIVVFLHMAQVFIFGAFKRPREATWLAGVLLLLLTLGFALTGYLLPWDNKAYWGTVVTTKIVAGLPFAGPVLALLAGAADGVGAITFARFYALHTLIFPALTIALIAIHVYLVRRHGITPAGDFVEKTQTFYPKQLFRDFSAVFIAFGCLFLAACFLDVPLEAMANPNDTAYVPRPEWYFLFLFQLLKIFPGQLELIGTLILPSVSILCLVMLPFLDRMHVKIPGKKIQLACVAVLAFSIWSALTAAAAFTGQPAEANARVSSSAVLWAQIPPEVIAGYGYFHSFRCESCHDLIVGTPKPGPILGLTGIQHPRDWMLQHFEDESRAQLDGARSPSLSLPQRNALVVFVANVKPDLLVTLLATSPQFINGAQTFVASACASCHKVNGIGGDSGPSLNGVFSRRSESWIRAHFAAPRKLSPGSIMPPYKFAPNDEQDLIKYLLSLPE
jgi:ubiquinol-cytochrome c reductase cytochrome b subunit